MLATEVTPGASAWMIEETVVGLAMMAGLIALTHAQVDATSERSRVTAFLTWRPIRFLGDISYSTYLVHYPIVAAVAIVWVRHLNLSVPAAFVLSRLCAGRSSSSSR